MYNFVKDIILPKKGNTECFEEISERGKHKIKCNFSATNYAYKNFVHFNLLRRNIYLILLIYLPSSIVHYLFQYL